MEEHLHQQVKSLEQTINDYQHRFDQLEKQIDDLMWFRRLEDIAFIDKVRLTGSPRWKPKSEDDRFAGNKLQFYAYLFIPKKIEWKKKHPLIVLPHSGIHANFSTYYYHMSGSSWHKGTWWYPRNTEAAPGMGKKRTRTSITGGVRMMTCWLAATTW